MTSLAFILGVLPLVFATGAGANARRSIGIAVLFVPSFFVVLQCLSERRRKAAAGTVAATSKSD
jgi:hydrophobic/amphiphilic exporter-1 (mainly G- bacteria), HAE1 family